MACNGTDGWEQDVESGGCLDGWRSREQCVGCCWLTQDMTVTDLAPNHCHSLWFSLMCQDGHHRGPTHYKLPSSINGRMALHLILGEVGIWRTSAAFGCSSKYLQGFSEEISAPFSLFAHARQILIKSFLLFLT